MFLLVPFGFHQRADHFYKYELGSCEISQENIWDVFARIRECFLNIDAPFAGPTTWAGLLHAISLPLDEGFNQLIPFSRVVPDHIPDEVPGDIDDIIEKEKGGVLFVLLHLLKLIFQNRDCQRNSQRRGGCPGGMVLRK